MLAGRPLWLRVLAVVLVSLLAAVLLVALFPWDVLRGPLNRYVSERTGRDFAITRKLDVKVGRTTRILADGIEVGNPPWAVDKHLVTAEAAEVQVRLWPWLVHRRVELPFVMLRKPQLGLQMESDGRRSWALGRDTRDASNVPHIGALVIDHGSLHFVAAGEEADVRADFSMQGGPGVASANAAASSMPLHFRARGTWRSQPFAASGRTGSVLYLSEAGQEPFPIEVDATAGATRLIARGTVASLRSLDRAQADVDLQGRNLAGLYKLLGVVLPESPPYSVRGHLSKSGETWRMQRLAGKLGNSDLAGELSLERERDVPHLTGHLSSKWLDFNDLAPLVGMEARPRGPRVEAQQKPAGDAKASKPPRDPGRKILPTTPIDLARLKAMNADVSYSAARVTNLRQLPLERIAVRARLNDGVLQLDPMNLGVAGGTLVGRMRIDSHANPAVVEAHLNARALELRKLMRNEQLIKNSFGRIHGDFDLSGRGNSTAQMLANANGSVSLLMGPGQVSNLLLEIAGLDGAEILKFLLGGDRNVPVRCAATAFDVSKGVMTSRAMVLDTADTVIWGDGNVNFANEAMDLYFRPYPKDTSILSLRAPIKVKGTLGAPEAGPDKSALGERAGLAVALGAINPLLALAATIETGPGKDANCGEVLRRAASHDASSAHAAPQAREEEARRMGGPPAQAKSLPGLDGRSLSDRERARQPTDPDARKPAGSAGPRPPGDAGQ